MPKVIFAVLLAVVAGDAAAKWVRVSADATHVAYADPATIRKAGSMARMWSVFDYYQAGPVLDNGKSYLSTRAQFEYDCSADRMRPLAVSFHSRNMASGEIVHSTFAPGDWGPVPPGTMNQALWKTACRSR